jgi:hypothetical protein
MSQDMSPHKSYRWPLLKAAPGLVKILSYQKSELFHDLVAGLSVAAVALPVGVAYAQLAGFNSKSTQNDWQPPFGFRTSLPRTESWTCGF